MGACFSIILSVMKISSSRSQYSVGTILIPAPQWGDQEPESRRDACAPAPRLPTPLLAIIWACKGSAVSQALPKILPAFLIYDHLPGCSLFGPREPLPAAKNLFLSSHQGTLPLGLR